MKTAKLYFLLSVLLLVSVACQEEFMDSYEYSRDESELPKLSIENRKIINLDDYNDIIAWVPDGLGGFEPIFGHKEEFAMPASPFIFGSYCDHGGIVDTKDSCNIISFTLTKPDEDVFTRDMEFYVDIYASDDNWGIIGFGDYGCFYHPIHIRQIGPKGTRYLTGEEYLSIVDNEGRWPHDLIDSWSNWTYLQGKVEEVGDIYQSPKDVMVRNGLQLAQQVSCFDLTVRTDDNVLVKIRVNELTKDSILTQLRSSLKKGDVIESGLFRACFDKAYGGFVDITALEVFKVDN